MQLRLNIAVFQKHPEFIVFVITSDAYRLNSVNRATRQLNAFDSLCKSQQQSWRAHKYKL